MLIKDHFFPENVDKAVTHWHLTFLRANRAARALLSIYL